MSPAARPGEIATAGPLVLPPELEAARQIARRDGLALAGRVDPAIAWALAQAGLARIVDVRTREELAFVGRVPGAVHAAWATGVELQRNPRFLDDLAAVGGFDGPVLLLCRSAVRSARAAEAATAAGHPAAFDILEGFEGRLDAQQRRGALDGWRHRGLPWVQG
jgi:rhodanese-related sulfurtransferase